MKRDVVKNWVYGVCFEVGDKLASFLQIFKHNVIHMRVMRAALWHKRAFDKPRLFVFFKKFEKFFINFP